MILHGLTGTRTGSEYRRRPWWQRTCCIVCDQCARVCPDELINLGGHRGASAINCWRPSLTHLHATVWAVI